ncbi:OB-fold-containig protein [Catalinimonas niigatensis]|uniref:OB-fold-containig protein n=1 Tax=Catalinimonas niigatensis TaxID=1397264 RepID=UPI0026654274|nr:OB-fold-containig protein [Catalinimonas niigatensis]WPP51640.1 DUF1449 family protein [Catalinimonas niigatensis]
MNDLFNAAIAAPNIIPTAMLIFVLVYWMVVIMGVIDVESIDVDIEVDTDVDGEISVSWLNHVLAFFNLGRVPFMVFMTFLIVPMWAISVMTNYYMGNESFLLAVILLIPIFILSAFIAKFTTQPFIKLFNHLENNIDQGERQVGKICTLMTTANSLKAGQAKINTSGAPLLLNVITDEGINMFNGDTGIVLEYMPDRNVYLIEPYVA